MLHKRTTVPPSDSEYSFPVFPRIILSGGNDLLRREMILGKLAPDSLFLRQNGKMLARLGRGFDVSRIAQT